MLGLNKDKKEIAFVIGDAPLTLKGDRTSLKHGQMQIFIMVMQVSIIHGLSTDPRE